MTTGKYFSNSIPSSQVSNSPSIATSDATTNDNITQTTTTNIHTRVTYLANILSTSSSTKSKGKFLINIVVLLRFVACGDVGNVCKQSITILVRHNGVAFHSNNESL